MFNIYNTPYKHFITKAATLLLLGALPPLLTACGVVADKNLLVVATLDGANITRGDLFALIRNLEDNKRPNIKSKSDLLRVLNQHIEERIKLPLGQKMEQEKKIDIPWDMALEQFFKQSGEMEEHYRRIWNMLVPEGEQTTPLMDEYNLTPKQIAATKAIVAQEVDLIRQKMLGDFAVAKLVGEDIEKKQYSLDQADLEREYKLRKEQFKKWEWMRFSGIRFPTAQPGSEKRAVEISDRLKAGENFDAIVNEFAQKDAGKVINTEIENNPDLPKFRGFWLAASGSDIGAIIGPVYLPEYTMQMQDAQGKLSSSTMPDAYVIFKVLERQDERELTLEEARPILMPELLLSQKIMDLRAQHGVQIFEENLPDPSQFTQDDPYKELDKANVQ